MQITISTRHGQLSAATKEKIKVKVEKLGRFHDRLTAIQVTVDLEQAGQSGVEARVSAERAEDFVAHDRSTSLLGSLDLVVQKLEQQLKRHQGKRVNHRHPGRRVLVDPLQGESDEVDSAEETDR